MSRWLTSAFHIGIGKLNLWTRVLAAERAKLEVDGWNALKLERGPGEPGKH